ENLTTFARDKLSGAVARQRGARGFARGGHGGRHCVARAGAFGGRIRLASSRRFLTEARHCPNLEVVRTLRNEQAHVAFALELQGQSAFELEGGGQQHRCADGFAQEVLHGGGVVLV